jgi:hypothetical protein
MKRRSFFALVAAFAGRKIAPAAELPELQNLRADRIVAGELDVSKIKLALAEFEAMRFGPPKYIVQATPGNDCAWMRDLYVGAHVRIPYDGTFVAGERDARFEGYAGSAPPSGDSL